MQAGELDERVTFQEKTVTRDTLGGEEEVWVPRGTVWAKVNGISGYRAHVADQVKEPSTVEVTIRLGLPVTRLWRGLWRGQTLNIQNIDRLPDRTGLLLTCTEGMNDG